VIGGGPAGYTLVDQLRLRGYRGELTLIDPDGLPRDRPPLSKEFLRGAMGRDELLFREAAWFEERAVRVLAGRVEFLEGVRTAEDAAGWELFLESGERILAELAVLATGTEPVRPALPGLDRAHVLYDLPDAAWLRDALAPGVRLSVVGGGLIGAEAAAVAAERGAVVTLVDPSGPAAGRAFGAHGAGHLESMHRERGVNVVRGRLAAVVAVPSGTAGEAEAGTAAEGGLAASGTEGTSLLTLADGRSWVADVVLLAAGAVARDGLARDVGAATAPDAFGGVLVDAAGRSTLPGLWAVGDVARGTAPGGAALPAHAHWETAVHSAEDAAAALLGQPGEERGARWFWSDRHGEHVEVVGDPTVGEVVRREDGRGLRGVFSVATDGVLLGAVTFDDARLARAARRLIDRGAPVDVGALADPEVSARELVRPAR